VKNCTLKPYFYIFLLHISSTRTRSLVSTCESILQTSGRKLRNQCKPRPLCVNSLSQNQFYCVGEGSKYAHWIGLYLSLHLSWVLGPFVHGRFQSLKTGEDTFGHGLTRLNRYLLQFWYMSIRWWLPSESVHSEITQGFGDLSGISGRRLRGWRWLMMWTSLP